MIPEAKPELCGAPLTWPGPDSHDRCTLDAGHDGAHCTGEEDWAQVHWFTITSDAA